MQARVGGGEDEGGLISWLDSVFGDSLEVDMGSQVEGHGWALADLENSGALRGADGHFPSEKPPRWGFFLSTPNFTARDSIPLFSARRQFGNLGVS